MPNQQPENSTLQDRINIQYVGINRLLLDAQNPRFAGILEEDASDVDILEKLKEEMHLDELIDSFKENGYYNTEPLLVIKKKKSNEFIVVEGNRRLAAIKVLLNSGERIKNKIRQQLSNEIPVAVYPSREALWSYLGFRHVNGPQEWDSYSKAIYVFSVNDKYDIPIKEVAKRIGDKHQTVIRMYNGLRVLNQAESNNYFDSSEVELHRFHFSHLYTILEYENTRKFLGITTSKKEPLGKNPVPRKKLNNLKLLIEFLFGSEDKSKIPVIKSQHPDLKHLDDILGNRIAINYLKEYSQEYSVLDNALVYTENEDYQLEDLVQKTLNSIRKVSGHLNRYKGDAELYDQVKELVEVAQEVLARMEAKRKEV